MTLSDEIQDHQVRCQPYLLTLRLLGRAEAVTERIAAVVAETTGAVLAEVAAADCDVRAAAGDGGPGPETLLQARLNRLAAAAADAVAATVAGNLAEMRCQLDRFDALTSAMWTVQRAVYGSAPRRRADGAVSA
jgi:methyl coenzyme M reductase beta subunit